MDAYSRIHGNLPSISAETAIVNPGVALDIACKKLQKNLGPSLERINKNISSAQKEVRSAATAAKAFIPESKGLSTKALNCSLLGAFSSAAKGLLNASGLREKNFIGKIDDQIGERERIEANIRKTEGMTVQQRVEHENQATKRMLAGPSKQELTEAQKEERAQVEWDWDHVDWEKRGRE